MTVMFVFMWTIIVSSQISLFPTVFTLRNAWVHVSIMNCSDMAFNIEALIDKTFGFGTTLNIPNVEPYNGHI